MNVRGVAPSDLESSALAQNIRGEEKKAPEKEVLDFDWPDERCAKREIPGGWIVAMRGFDQYGFLPTTLPAGL